ncbi:MAG: metallopeptidase family protein [Planctomycetaceae bacterium]|nr:hypothetical protein [Planctomycetota bacterium]NUN52995.1 metallopeptidase family protein [Planctomycetaceae bacterium]
MRLRAFVRLAREEFEAVPEEFRRGVAGPVVVRRSRRHRRIPGYCTLGMCVPVSTMFTLGEEHLSTVFLWYGSFVSCAMRDPGFDIAAEVRETIRHEIRHHIEDRAGSPALRNEDAAEEQDERRRSGLPFEPGYYRLGEREGKDLWRLHDDLFLEILLDHGSLARARRRGLRVEWRGERLRVPAGDLASLPAFLEFEGEGDGEEGGRAGDLVLVVRER